MVNHKPTLIALLHTQSLYHPDKYAYIESGTLNVSLIDEIHEVASVEEASSRSWTRSKEHISEAERDGNLERNFRNDSDEVTEVAALESH